MLPVAETPIALSFDLPGLSPAEVAEAGRQVASFLEAPAFRAVATAIRSHQGHLTAELMGRSASQEGARYADTVGQLKAISRFEPILVGVVESGKQAEAEIRKAEQEGQF
jgi:hypothetical protein